MTGLCLATSSLPIGSSRWPGARKLYCLSLCFVNPTKERKKKSTRIVPVLILEVEYGISYNYFSTKPTAVSADCSVHDDNFPQKDFSLQGYSSLVNSIWGWIHQKYLTTEFMPDSWSVIKGKFTKIPVMTELRTGLLALHETTLLICNIRLHRKQIFIYIYYIYTWIYSYTIIHYYIVHIYIQTNISAH